MIRNVETQLSKCPKMEKKRGHQKDQGSPQSQFRVPKSRMHIERSDYYKQDQWIN